MAMLRWFVALTLLANLGYAAWQAGWLAPVGLSPAIQREPGRLERQLNPNALRVLSPSAAAAALAEAASAPAVGPPEPAVPPAAAASAPPVPASGPSAASAATPSVAATAAMPGPLEDGPLACLEIGPLEGNAAVEGVERVLGDTLPGRDWSRQTRPAGAQYAVFVGPINSRESARTRREELTKLKMSFEAIELPGGRQGGYSLGLHDSEAAALAALERFRERGLRSARVVQARENAPQTWLQMDTLTATQADAVRALDAARLGGLTPADCVVDSVMAVDAPR